MAKKRPHEKRPPGLISSAVMYVASVFVEVDEVLTGVDGTLVGVTDVLVETPRLFVGTVDALVEGNILAIHRLPTIRNNPIRMAANIPFIPTLLRKSIVRGFCMRWCLRISPIEASGSWTVSLPLNASKMIMRPERVAEERLDPCLEQRDCRYDEGAQQESEPVPENASPHP